MSSQIIVAEVNINAVPVIWENGIHGALMVDPVRSSHKLVEVAQGCWEFQHNNQASGEDVDSDYGFGGRKEDSRSLVASIEALLHEGILLPAQGAIRLKANAGQGKVSASLLDLRFEPVVLFGRGND